MANQRVVTSMRGCINPLCPGANWSAPELPHWWCRLDDGQTAEFAACDERCAREASRYLGARYGRRPGNAPAGVLLTCV